MFYYPQTFTSTTINNIKFQFQNCHLYCHRFILFLHQGWSIWGLGYSNKALLKWDHPKTIFTNLLLNSMEGWTTLMHIDALSLAIELDNSVSTHSISVQPTRGFCCTNQTKQVIRAREVHATHVRSSFSSSSASSSPSSSTSGTFTKAKKHYILYVILLMAKQNPTSPKRCINNPHK